MDKLYAHLHKSMASPFIWGEDDCMLNVANYLLFLTGYDCGTRFRGKYDSALTCQRISDFLTNPVKPFSDCVAEFPLSQTVEPVRGDVGVIEIIEQRKVKATGAIFLGNNWSIKAEHGLAIGPAHKILKAWKAPDICVD